jgi:bifunctional non-homologous end joining protein LigD
MLATAPDASVKIPLQDPGLLYEPKYDGIRALVALEPGHPVANVRFWSRNGNEKTAQFPDLVKALQEVGRNIRVPLLLDGEIVALDAQGEPAGFQPLQGRMHVTDAREIVRLAREQPVAILMFDILREGGDDVRPLPLWDRRARLERLLEQVRSSTVRIGEYAAGDGHRLYEQALAKGWEGLLVKASDSLYESGRRSYAWQKFKLQKQQEFVVGGWTEPRQTRPYFGALLLGAYVPSASGDGGRELRYVGHSGTGFTQRELQRVFAMLEKLKTETCPFRTRPASNERPHWVRPELVAQVRFSDWTNEGVLRHPVYLGLRDDIDPGSVTIEPSSLPSTAKAAAAGSAPASASANAPASARARATSAENTTSAAIRTTSKSKAKTATSAEGKAQAKAPTTAPAKASGKASVSAAARKKSGARGRGVGKGLAPDAKMQQVLQLIVDHLRALEDARRDGTLTLPDGSTLDVTNLAKVFWPDERLTKGDLLRFYVQVSPYLLPVVEDRPLVMRRFPNGIKAKAFYQQRAPDDVPKGVRIETTPDEGEESGYLPRLVGGSLQTLLYMTQLAAVSQDPWFSRVQSQEYPDYVALDLDPMPGVPFTQVLDVARAVHEELDTLGIPACPKTSGASGMHVYIPLPPETTYETGQLLCHVVAAIVSSKHRRIATIERQVAKRGRTVYVDYLQNIEGKTLATAYSARANEFAGVSTPLTWDEVHDGVAPQDFTLRTAIGRFEKTGDLWGEVIGGTSVDLAAVLARLAKFADI